jgi:heme/copper-type cytochrome/quinol oxidase subunit 2
LSAAGAVAVCLAIAGCGGDSEPAAPSTTTAATVSTAPRATTAETTATEPVKTLIQVGYAGGTITGGGRQEAPVGSTVSIQVTSDVADEVHLHGYDKKVDVTPDAPATLTFTADIPGIFEVELESRAIKLIDLVVK